MLDELDRKDLKTAADKWIIAELEEAKKAISNFIENKEISLAQARLRRFTWDQFADWYVEINKIEKNYKVLGYVLNNIIKMWHPFTPFVTEKMWRMLKGSDALLMMEKWPEEQKDLNDKEVQTEFETLMELIGKIRNIRAVYHISPAEIIEAYSPDFSGCEVVEKLARVKISNEINHDKNLRVSVRKINLELAIGKLIDVNKEIKAAEKEIANLENLIAKTEALSKNENFISKANADIINATNARLDEYKQKLVVQKELIDNLKGLL